MNSKHSNDLTLFNEALEIAAPEARAAYLDRACGDDAALRRKIDSLLAAYEKASDKFEDPDGNVPTLVSETPGDLEGPGSVIGRYKLLQQIGEGGCGVVYMAEQEEPVRRRVALKVIKLGMDTKSLIARFEAERQALAMMDEPNIAKVFDAGATDSGRPYFVMELIRGVKITEYCDEAKLSTRDRLDLFIKVCQAIQHAHQKGIIHRDIKPSNILVTLHDGLPVPKVIDFGIAKATGARLTDKTVFTQFEAFIGTPAYMSPEQAEMSGLDIDTRSDIYSLGVLLYELLTGKTPFDAKELFEAGFDEMRRTICEKQPVRPSTRLSAMLAGGLTAASKSRQTDAGKLIHLLRGDLDWIAMKCIEKDRTRRYETANALAMDVKRHLDNEPVTARPPSAAYRFQKMVRRNKLVFATSTAIVLTLAGSAYYAQRQAFQSNRILLRMRISQAEDLFAQRKASAALASLARVLRDRPNHRVAAERIMSALTQRNFILPEDQVLAHRGQVNSVRVSRDGNRIVTASEDRTGRIWEARTGQSVGQPLTHALGVLYAEESPDGRLMVTASRDGTARVWDGHTGKPLTPPLKHRDFVLCARFSPDGQSVLTASRDNTAQLWDVHTGQALLPRPLSHGGAVLAAEFSPDGRHVATGSRDRTARVWDVKTGEPASPPLAHRSEVRSVQFSPDGARLLTVSWENLARLWDVQTGQELPISFRHPEAVTSAEFSADGQWILTASLDRTAQIWDAQGGQPFGPPLLHEDKLVGARFGGEGRSIVTITESGSVTVWETNSFRPRIEPLRHHIDMANMNKVGLTPDGQHLLTAVKSSVCIWDLRVSRLVPVRVRTQALLANLSRYSPNGRLVARDSDANCVQIFQVKPNEPLSGLLRHEQQITAAVFSPDGERLLTASMDKTARIWDARTGQPVIDWLRHESAVVSAQFDGGNDRVITVLEDKSTWLWEVPVASAAIPRWLPELAEAVAGQRINRRGIPEPVSVSELLGLVRRFTAGSPSDSYSAWTRRLFQRREQPLGSPSQSNPSP